MMDDTVEQCGHVNARVNDMPNGDAPRYTTCRSKNGRSGRAASGSPPLSCAAARAW